MLEKLGCEVDVTSDGQAAVEAGLLTSYDAIFLDCHMPVLDGISAAVAIRAERSASSNAPIIAVTAEVFQETRALCLAAGMDDFLEKPLRLNDLRAAVERWVAAPAS
jgi:CheY-like chemotaxis protein